MKVAMVCVLLLCLLLVVMGVLVWFTPYLLIEKIVSSAFSILSGVAFGSMAIESLRDGI